MDRGTALRGHFAKDCSLQVRLSPALQDPASATRMSTQIPPPPKRVRLTPSANTRDPLAPAPTIVAQFKNAADGSLLGPPLSLPADTTREGLELLVNNLRGSVSRSLQLRYCQPRPSSRRNFLTTCSPPTRCRSRSTSTSLRHRSRRARLLRRKYRG